MIVSTSLIRRRDDVTLEQFQRHWLDPHGPLTARLPGTLRYDQNHVIPEAPGTNAAARSMWIDGLPMLVFDSPESRRAAHHSLEMAACNADSRDFIGAVARVISDDGDKPRPADARSFIKQIFLVPRGATRIDLGAVLSQIEGICASVPHAVLEQGAAPNSTVPFIGIDVESLAEVWVRDPEAVEANAVWLDKHAPEIATFQVKVYQLM